MSNDKKIAQDTREEALKTAVKAADAADGLGHHSVDAQIKYYDAAADTLKNGDPATKAVIATMQGNYGTNLVTPDPKEYLANIARYGEKSLHIPKDFVGLNQSNFQLHTPEQEAASVEMLKKYGVSDPDGRLAAGLAYAAHLDVAGRNTYPEKSVMDPGPGAAHTSIDITAPVANMTTPSTNRIIQTQDTSNRTWTPPKAPGT